MNKISIELVHCRLLVESKANDAVPIPTSKQECINKKQKYPIIILCCIFIPQMDMKSVGSFYYENFVSEHI